MFVSFALCTVFAVISVFATCCVNSASSSRIILTPFQKIPNVLPLLHPTVQHKWNGMTLQTSLLHRRAGKHSPHTTAESHNTNACWCMQLVDAVPEIYDTSNAHAINTKSFVCISVEIPNGTAEANGKQMHQVIGLYPTRTLSVYIGRYMQRKHKQMDRANNRARERNWKPNFLFQSSRYGSAKFDSVTLNAQADLSAQKTHKPPTEEYTVHCNSQRLETRSLCFIATDTHTQTKFYLATFSILFFFWYCCLCEHGASVHSPKRTLNIFCGVRGLRQEYAQLPRHRRRSNNNENEGMKPRYNFLLLCISFYHCFHTCFQ